MIKIVIEHGDAVCVELADSDGRFEIRYGETELTVTSDLPGSHLGGEGVIYREVFAGCTCADSAGPVDPRCPEHGDFGTEKFKEILR